MHFSSTTLAFLFISAAAVNSEAIAADVGNGVPAGASAPHHRGERSIDMKALRATKPLVHTHENPPRGVIIQKRDSQQLPGTEGAEVTVTVTTCAKRPAATVTVTTCKVRQSETAPTQAVNQTEIPAQAVDQTQIPAQANAATSLGAQFMVAAVPLIIALF